MAEIDRPKPGLADEPEAERAPRRLVLFVVLFVLLMFGSIGGVAADIAVVILALMMAAGCALLVVTFVRWLLAR